MKMQMTKQISLQLKTLTLVILGALVSISAQAAPTCNGGEDGLLKCYQREYSQKLDANDDRHRELVARGKELVEEAGTNGKPTGALIELVRQANRTLSSSRRIAIHQCVRMAAKFKSSETSAIASVNCRSGHEVQLEKDLRRLELRLEVLSIQN